MSILSLLLFKLFIKILKTFNSKKNIYKINFPYNLKISLYDQLVNLIFLNDSNSSNNKLINIILLKHFKNMIYHFIPSLNLINLKKNQYLQNLYFHTNYSIKIYGNLNPINN